MVGVDESLRLLRRRCVAWTCAASVVCALEALTGAVAARQDHTAIRGTKPEQSAFLDLLHQYRHGDADAAVARFAPWDIKRVEAEARLPNGQDDPWQLAALAMLHTEANLANDLAGQTWPVVPAGIPTAERSGGEPDVHRRLSFAIMQSLTNLAQNGGDERLVDFCRRWTGAAGGSNRSLPDRDPLWDGRFHEHWMGPEVCCGGTGFQVRIVGESARIQTSHGKFVSPHYLDAEKFFRQILSSEPAAAEARLRLGRVLYLLDRAKDAEEEFDRALRDARDGNDVFSGYLAGLFLGRLYEDKGRNTRIRRHTTSSRPARSHTCHWADC
jgi:tetratricopeptide (TPR) repeat protein